MSSRVKERLQHLIQKLGEDTDSADVPNEQLQLPTSFPVADDDAHSVTSDAVTDLSDITTTDATESEFEESHQRPRTRQKPSAWNGRIQQLEHKVLQLSRDKSQLQTQYDHDLKLKSREILQLRQQLDHELKSIEKRQHEVEAKAPLLSQQLQQAKVAVSSLQMSDDAYRELKQRPTESLHLADHVKVVVHEALRELKADNERLRMAVEASREAGARLETDKARLQRENSRLAAELVEKEADIESSIGGLQARIERLAHELEASLTQVEVLSAKGQMYDQLQSNYDKLEEEVVRLRAVEAGGRQVERRVGELEGALKERDHSLQLLVMDKAYLGQQVEGLQEQVQRLEREVEAKGSRVSELKKARQELWDRLVTEGSSAREAQRSSLQAEVARIQTAAQADVDRIRKENTEAYERESRLLRDLRDEAQAQATHCQASLRALQREHTALGQKHMEAVRQLEQRAVEAEGRASAAELARHTMEQLAQEREAGLKRAQAQVDMLQSKVAVLTDSYYTLEAERAKTVAELGGRVEQQAAALAQYQALEGTLDDAILQAAGLPEGPNNQGGEQLAKMLDAAGLAAIRTRLRHGLAVAARCAHLEAEKALLSKELEAARARATRLEADLAKARLLGHTAGQPHSELVEALGAARQQVEEAQQQLQDLQAVVAAKDRAALQLASENGALKTDLGRVLSERANLHAVKAMVTAALGPLGLAPRPATAAAAITTAHTWG